MYNVNGMCKTKGFTLIELLITISIIAVLSAIGFNTFSGSQKRAMDARRQSDLSQYRVALENYASVNGSQYPLTSGVSDQVSAGNGIFQTSGGVLNGYLTGWPKDPKQNTATGYDYYYREDATGTNWVLQACMEAGVDRVYQVCSNGLSGVKAGTTSCPTNPSSTCVLP